MPLTFPTHLFKPAAIRPSRRGGVISGGESLSGVEDVIHTSGGGFWIVSMSGIELIDPDLVRAWRAWEAHLDNGAVDVLVPIADVRQAPRPFAGGMLARPSALKPTSDDPYFPEATAFATPFVVATIVTAAALRATQVMIEVTRGARLKGGEFFALTHPTKGRRLYMIERVLYRTGQHAVVKIMTPLREAVAAGTTVDFDWPSLVCRLVPGTDISPDLQQGRSASVGILFRESL